MSTLKFDLMIHSNRKNKIPALVSYSSFKKHNPTLNITIENLEDRQLLMNYHEKTFFRGNNKLQLNVNSSQSFFFVRFICCEIAKRKNLKKWVLIIDPDIFCLKSVELLNNFILEAENKNKDIICYNLLSSFMLINTAKIDWSEENIVNNIFTLKEDADNYMLLKKYKNSVLNIPEEYNSYDILNSNTICLHTSLTITQPWKTGIKYYPSDLHNKIPSKNEKKNCVFLKHKSDKIEKITINMFKEALNNKYFTDEDLKEEIYRENIRADIFKLFN